MRPGPVLWASRAAGRLHARTSPASRLRPGAARCPGDARRRVPPPQGRAGSERPLPGAQARVSAVSATLYWRDFLSEKGSGGGERGNSGFRGQLGPGFSRSASPFPPSAKLNQRSGFGQDAEPRGERGTGPPRASARSAPRPRGRPSTGCPPLPQAR